MSRRDYTMQQKMKLLAAALDLCPTCEAEYVKYAFVPGRGDPFELFREILWKWFGQWSHGAGCPPEAFPEARSGAPADAQKVPDGQVVLDSSLAFPKPSGGSHSAETPQPYSVVTNASSSGMKFEPLTPLSEMLK